MRQPGTHFIHTPISENRRTVERLMNTDLALIGRPPVVDRAAELAAARAAILDNETDIERHLREVDERRNCPACPKYDDEGKQTQPGRMHTAAEWDHHPGAGRGTMKAGA